MDVGAGTRVRNIDFRRGWSLELQNGNVATWDLAAGTEGIVTGPYSGATDCWWVEWDGHPTEPTATHLMNIEVVVYKIAEAPIMLDCVCSIPSLMSQGCVCGHLTKRYVPPNMS